MPSRAADGHSYGDALHAMVEACKGYIAVNENNYVVTRETSDWYKARVKELEQDWWPRWPRHEQSAFRGEMVDLKKLCSDYIAALEEGRDPEELPKLHADTLARMRLSYNRLEYLVYKISIACGPSNEHWIHETQRWFREGIIRHVRPSEFDNDFGGDTVGKDAKRSILATFAAVLEAVRQAVKDGKTPVLPDLSDKRKFWALHDLFARVAMLPRSIDAVINTAAQPSLVPGGAMHSLAHGSTRRFELSARQQSVYGRRYAHY